MPRDKSGNHEKIKAAAYDEFLKYGFADASMRRIATSCGMSAAGLYKHFSSKEEMFAALVEPAYLGLKKAYGLAAGEETGKTRKGRRNTLRGDRDETSWMMNYIYDNFRAFKLLVCRSQGTRVENFVHELAAVEEENTNKSMNKFRELGVKVSAISDREMHILITTRMNAIFLAVENGLTREEALEYVRHLDEFYKAGWERLLRLKK